MGYLKYSGKHLENGIWDARKAGAALLGFDEIIRYFLIKEVPTLKEEYFQIPIKTDKGSWIILIPEISGSVILTTYGIHLAKQAATEGLFNTGLAKDIETIFRNSLKTIQWVIKIAKHLKIFDRKKIKSVSFDEKNDLEIQNE